MTRTTVFLAVCTCALALPLGAQESTDVVKKRWVYRPATPVVIDEFVRPDRIEVKFVEGIRVRLVDGTLTALEGADLRAIHTLFAPFRVERLFTRSVEDLDRERERLQRNVPDDEEPLADLNNYYRVITDGAESTRFVVESLLEHPLIETAYPEGIPVMASGDLPPTTPDHTSIQLHLDAAPRGLNFAAMDSIVGMRGQSLWAAHLEGDWDFGHEDLCLLTNASILGMPPNQPSWKPHGTACVGIMSASRNAYGVRGMGSDVDRFYVCSLANGSANQISISTGALRPGDVMSSSYVFLTGDPHHKPIDFLQASWDAVRAATTAGIVYTFSAGNSSSNLNDTTIFGDRYLPTTASSGGFIIGATDHGNLRKADFSSYGTRIDTNGWGRRVGTTGYGDLFEAGPNDLQDYTAVFNGTSAAAPMVAGAALGLIGAVREQNGVTLTPEQVRTAFQTTGTTLNGRLPIGKRPDMAQLLALYNLPDGLLGPSFSNLGSNAALTLTGPAAAPFSLVLSTGRGNTAFGANRPLLLDTSTLIAFGHGNLDSNGAGTVQIPLPVLPALRDTDFYVQGAQIRSAALHLTNSIMLWLR